MRETFTAVSGQQQGVESWSRVSLSRQSTSHNRVFGFTRTPSTPRVHTRSPARTQQQTAAPLEHLQACVGTVPRLDQPRDATRRRASA
jgi:hypothetical protein